ncbi:MAG: WXG100 family type VII secretion target, partial [Pseudoclavibacter sp.]
MTDASAGWWIPGVVQGEIVASGMFGANPEELRTIGDDFRGQGDHVERAGFDVRREIENVNWFGADAETYRETFANAMHAEFVDLVGTLGQYRDELRTQADRQDEASQPGDSEGCLESTWNGTKSFFGNLFGAVWGDIQGIATLVGFDENWNWSLDNLKETWTGMGVLIGYNPSDGTWGNWGLAGESWTELGKSIIAWDQWGDDNAGASGTTL